MRSLLILVAVLGFIAAAIMCACPPQVVTRAYPYNTPQITYRSVFTLHDPFINAAPPSVAIDRLLAQLGIPLLPAFGAIGLLRATKR